MRFIFEQTTLVKSNYYTLFTILGLFSLEPRLLCPHLPPPPSEEKNGQNQPFSANFWIFAPSESHFAPSMPPQKILVPPLFVTTKPEHFLHLLKLFCTIIGNFEYFLLTSNTILLQFWTLFVHFKLLQALFFNLFKFKQCRSNQTW